MYSPTSEQVLRKKIETSYFYSLGVAERPRMLQLQAIDEICTVLHQFKLPKAKDCVENVILKTTDVVDAVKVRIYIF